MKTTGNLLGLIIAFLLVKLLLNPQKIIGQHARLEAATSHSLSTLASTIQMAAECLARESAAQHPSWSASLAEIRPAQPAEAVAPVENKLAI